MAKDYKHRVQNPSYAGNRKRGKKAPTVWWRWLLVIVLIVAFVVFLNLIRSKVSELISGKPEAQTVQTEATTKHEVPIPAKSAANHSPEKAEEPEKPVEPEEPRYDFYTILPQAETVVPDYEIKTRVREELVGKTKATKYVMQAGSFRDVEEANRHKAKLAKLGIEAWVEKAKVGSVIWYRIKIGPYDNPSSVATIKELLQKNGVGVVVTEQGK